MYFEFLLVSVIEGELDEVVGKGLHLLTYPEPVPVYLLVLLCLLEIYGVKALRNTIVITESLLVGDNRKCLPGTNLDHQQLILLFLPRLYILYLSHIKDHAILSGRRKIKPFLANPLNPVGANQIIRFNIHL